MTPQNALGTILRTPAVWPYDTLREASYTHRQLSHFSRPLQLRCFQKRTSATLSSNYTCSICCRFVETSGVWALVCKCVMLISVCALFSYDVLTPSLPTVCNCRCSKGSASYWFNPPFLIFDIRALWRSVLSARAPECQKIKNGGLDQYGKV